MVEFQHMWTYQVLEPNTEFGTVEFGSGVSPIIADLQNNGEWKIIGIA